MAITTERIYQFENVRANGSLGQKLSLVNRTLPEEAGVNMGSWSTLPKIDQVNLMRAWRIWTTTLMQLYRGEWNGNRAANFLWKARDIANQYYDHNLAMEAAREMRIDPEGHEYQMRTEMRCDQGKLALSLAELTGNPVLIREATQRFELAILAAEEGSATRALAAMEHKITLKKSGTGIDWPWFNTNYQTVANSTEWSGNWDRLAAASWMYAKEALWAGRKTEFFAGLKNLQAACQNLGTSWVKYPLKEALAIPLSLSRRATYSTKTQYFEAAGH